MKDALFLELGRLDGCLQRSPARVLWGARMRLRAVAQASVAAGVPVNDVDVERWFAGSDEMPRRGEGLNDPMRLATVAHLTLAAQDAGCDGLSRACANFVRAVFDHRAVALGWAPEELVMLVPLQRSMVDTVKRHTALDLGEVAALIQRMMDNAVDQAQPLVVREPNGPAVYFVRSRSTSWLALSVLPLAAQHAGLTSNLIPNLVPPPRVFADPAKAESRLLAFLAREVAFGRAELDRLERGLVAFDALTRTTRSRIARAGEYRLTFPTITGERMAAALGTTAQGANYLLRRLAAA
jgi:hypothetical protein